MALAHLSPLASALLVLIACAIMLQAGMFKKRLRWVNRANCPRCRRPREHCACHRRWGV